jgi:hypothetical protein
LNEDFKKWDAINECNQNRYDLQSQIIEDTLNTSNHSLNELLKKMRTKGEPVIYLSGTRLDHDYVLGSNDIGTAISVLPQDGYKAAVPGYHPGSTEVYVIFQGSLCIETLQNGSVNAINCGQFDVYVIPPGECHRVTFDPQRLAASYLVKTNPSHEPKVIRCDGCTYYEDKCTCPLNKSWQQDELRINEEKRKS